MKGVVLFFPLLACSAPTPAAPSVGGAPVDAAASDTIVLADPAPGAWVGAPANAPVAPTGIWAAGNLVIAAGAGKILRSIDRGSHWTASEGPGDRPVVWGSSADDIFVAGKGVVRSKDRGITWTKVAAPPGPVSGIWGTPSGDLVWAVGGSADGPSFIAKSRDHGLTWIEVKHQQPVRRLYDVLGSPDGKTVYFAGERRNPNARTVPLLMRTFDDSGMELLNAPAPGSAAHDKSRKICVSGSGAIVTTTSLGVHVSRDQARSWDFPEAMDTEVLALSCSGKHIVAGGRERQLRISDNEGVTWKKNEADAVLGEASIAITAAYVFPNGDVILGAESHSKEGRGTLLRLRR